MNHSHVRALAFDVFGTVVDWRGSLIRELTALNLDLDPAGFADAWRGGYGPAMRRVASGDLPWTNIDTLHRLILDELLQRFAVTGLSEPAID
ncbi:MAG TPA: haloacid dehalogenase type II, partial [Chloroflexota bacterium]|nr:haloacid dehalogenase type II [Chloroflexota bacterium]